MSVTERARAVWAEWAPEYRKGRLGIGPIIIITRSEMGRSMRNAFKLGCDAPRRSEAASPRKRLHIV